MEMRFISILVVPLPNSLSPLHSTTSSWRQSAAAVSGDNEACRRESLSALVVFIVHIASEYLRTIREELTDAF